MDKIQMCVDSLITAIRDGEAYRRYLDCEEKLQKQPDLRKKIDEFRAAVYHLNNAEEQIDLFDKIDEFEKEYREFRKIPVVNEFLEAELDVCRLLQRVRARIQSGVDVRIPRV